MSYLQCPFCGSEPRYEVHTGCLICLNCKFSLRVDKWQSRQRSNSHQLPESLTLTLEITEDGKLYSYRHESSRRIIDDSECDIIGMVAKDMYRHLSKSLKTKEKKDEYERL